jgi:hypothetical protein
MNFCYIEEKFIKYFLNIDNDVKTITQVNRETKLTNYITGLACNK